jgi:predicted O-linked N-acetylglucosamine transferase (SPINDLY family)
LLAQRPAPVQVNYLGYPGTMGAPYIDAIIADGFVIPPENDRFYAETIVRLPHCFQANDDRRQLDPVPTRAGAGLPDEGFVFCCFASCYKITPTLFGIAMRLLAAVPGSVLWLAVGPAEARANLRSAAASQGIDPERLVFAEQIAYTAHLGRLSLADLVLDTYPFNGGTTISDALWAGVPVVTRAGQPFAARMAGSLLQTVGLPELITTEFETYESVALHLAQDPGALAAVRQRLQEGVKTSPLFDTATFCRDFEAALVALHDDANTLAGR